MALTAEITPRITVYTVGAAPSVGPFPIPFPFYDEDEVGVYVNGARVSLLQFQTAQDFSTEGATVTLEVPVANATVAIVSETGPKRTTSDNFVQAELSAEIDRIFALFQEAAQFGLRMTPEKAGLRLGTAFAGDAGGRALLVGADGQTLLPGPTGDQIRVASDAAAQTLEAADRAAASEAAAALSLQSLLAKITVSPDAPSGGAEGDIWFKYET